MHAKPFSKVWLDDAKNGVCRANGATFDWKGSSYLFFIHSHWEVLGYGKDEENGLEWAVTCEL